MVATINNLYPYNMVLQFLGCAGWLWVSIIWNDRALIVVYAVAVAIATLNPGAALRIKSPILGSVVISVF